MTSILGINATKKYNAATGEMELTAGQSATDSTISITDISINNASTTKHGWFPKLPASTGKFLKDDLTWATIAGGGDMLKATYDPGGVNAQLVGTSDSRLSDSRVPTVHDSTKHSVTYALPGDITTHAAVQTGVHGISIVAGKTLTANKSITLEGTDSTTMTFPSTAATIGRIDANNTIPFDGDLWTMGYNDTSKFRIGGFSTSAGTLANLVGGGDYVHYYLTHNVINASGTQTTVDDNTSTSYALVTTGLGKVNTYQAPASASPAVWSSTPTFSLDMIAGTLQTSGAMTASNISCANTIIGNTVLSAGYSSYIPHFCEIVSGIIFEIGLGSYLEIG